MQPLFRCAEHLLELRELKPHLDSASLFQVEKQVADAVQKGATVILGGARSEKGGKFFLPTVLTNVTPDMLCYCEETFGPVAAIVK